MMDDKPKKRNPAIEMFIVDVNAESSRVAIVGEISSKTDTVAVLQDRTGLINLLFQKHEMMSPLKVGNIYRVIGIVLPHDQGVEVKVEIVQDFAGFDLEGYYDYLEKKKVK